MILQKKNVWKIGTEVSEMIKVDSSCLFEKEKALLKIKKVEKLAFKYCIKLRETFC